MPERLGRKTAPGFADPASPMNIQGQQPPAAAPPAGSAGAAQPNPPEGGAPQTGAVVQSAPAKHTPLVEVEVTYERGSAPRAEPIRRAFEVWTQNNVYAVNSRMRCVEVRTLATGQPIPDHPFLGTRLVGGQIKGNDAMELSYPLPRPGSFAVFEGRRGNRRQFSRTSAVERVALHLRIVTITGKNVIPTWEDIVGDMDAHS